MIKYILAALACGTIAGYSNSRLGDVFLNRFVSYYLFNACLVFLLFVMGFALGADKGAIVKMRKAGLKILVLPMTIALGSIVGGIVSGLLLRIDLLASAAVSAGYGWYTLAGPLMGQVFGPEWSALGFMVNFLRELLTIVTVSVMVRVDRYAPIALGGRHHHGHDASRNSTLLRVRRSDDSFHKWFHTKSYGTSHDNHNSIAQISAYTVTLLELSNCGRCEINCFVA